MFSFLPIWSLMWRSCSTFSMISDFSSDWSARARCVFDIKISRLKSFEPALCHTYWYCIMFINITNFFSSLSCIVPFFSNKISKYIEFLLYFHSFSRRNNFWLNKQVSQLFFKLLYVMSSFKRMQILPESNNTIGVMRSWAIYWENMKKLFPQSNILFYSFKYYEMIIYYFDKNFSQNLYTNWNIFQKYWEKFTSFLRKDFFIYI